ncbi:hypothetical protein [uncultured Cellulomonas sp.]|uniref:hypothetical protein n=1 Tax=uncultured Cellulomonas sp. TaxID=189682 RepID=UPI0026307033|nr:hypothetical protein [uncultured Cellulomonas sp.]
MAHGDGSPVEPGHEGDEVMDLLAEHIPLALLLDLAPTDGPASEEILRAEGVPDDAWWEPEPAGAELVGEATTEPTRKPTA